MTKALGTLIGVLSNYKCGYDVFKFSYLVTSFHDLFSRGKSLRVQGLNLGFGVFMPNI